MLKVGDRVVIRNDLKEYHKYDMENTLDNSQIVVPSMMVLRGKTVIISEARQQFYRIEEDGGCWCWTDQMFEDLKSNKRTIEIIRMKTRGV